MTEDTSENRVTLTEAARIAGVHFNTARNWRKAGRLKSAEKVFTNGIEIWTVLLSEVQEIVQQSSLQSTVNTSQQFVDNNPVNSEPANPTAISASAENTLALIREVTKPLTDVIERQQETIEKQQARLEAMSEELGELKATVNQLKTAPNTSYDRPQSAPTQQEITSSTPPENPPQNAFNASQAELVPAPTPTPKKSKWWERWM